MATSDSGRLRRGSSSGIVDPGRFFKTFQLRCYEPLPDHADMVANFWILRWDAALNPNPSYEYLPTQPSAGMFLAASQPFIMGVVKDTLLVKAHGNGVMAGIRFKPGGLYSYSQRNRTDLMNKKIPASQVFPAVDKAFIAHLYGLREDMEMVNYMETLLGKSDIPDENIVLINKIVAEIEQDNGTHSPASLAVMFGMSERSLRHLFRTYVGVGVKWVIMRVRLLHAIRQAHSLERPDWTTIAADLGYSTQSHFVNEFKKYFGMSPSQYVKTAELSSSPPVL